MPNGIASPAPILLNDKEIVHTWPKGTVLITGDSMLNGIEERKLCKPGRTVKVRPFSGATVDAMFDYLKPLIKKCPSKIILAIGTNNTPYEQSRVILDKTLRLKNFLEKSLPDAEVVISSLINRIDAGKATLTVIKLNEHLASLELKLIDNSNIDSSCLSEGGLHLHEKSYGRLALNFMKGMKLIDKC